LVEVEIDCRHIFASVPLTFVAVLVHREVLSLHVAVTG